MNKDIKVLMIEDSEADAELVIHQLIEAGYQVEYELVDTTDAVRRGFTEKRWDIVLCDYSMPNLDPFKVLNILKEFKIDIPLIVISGKIGESNAVALLKAGCHDCIMKNNIVRLPEVVRREIHEALIREENRQLDMKLQKYQILCNSANDIMLFMDVAGNILDVNQAAIKCYGYGYDEFLTKSILDLRHLSNKELVHTQMKTAIAGNIFFEAIHYRKDNSAFFVEVSSQGILLNGQNLIFSIVRNITERKQNEEHREQYLRDLLESQRIAHVGTWRLDVETNQVVWSDELYKMYDFDPSIPPPPYTEHIKLFTPESWEKLSTALEITRTSGIPYELELETKKTDGSNGWMWVRGEANKDSRGNIISLWGAAQDITKRKREQEELQYERNMAQMYLDTAGVMLLALDKDGKVALINREGCQILECEKEDTVGKNWFDLFIPDSARKNTQQLFDNILTGKDETSGYNENLMITANGKERSMLWHNKLLRDLAGNIIGIFSSGTDITERKKAEDAIKASEEKYTYISYHDQLTGVYNRRFFEEELVRIDKNTNLPISIAMGDINGLKLINDSFGHAAGDEILIKTVEAIKKVCRSDDIIARLGGDEFAIILPKTNASETEQIITRIRNIALKEKISNLNPSISFGYATKTQDEEIIYEILQNAENYMYRHKLYEHASIKSKTIDIIMNTLFEKSNRESLHSKRVSSICEEIATKMKLGADEINKIRIAGLVHDIGKISIYESILNKNGNLSDDEWKAMKKHPESGWRILSSANEFVELARYIYEHHEKWDGSGYPRGLKGNEITIEARIIAIADAFDAMTSERTYRKAICEADAVMEITRCAGTHFDPVIAKLFVEEVVEKYIST